MHRTFTTLTLTTVTLCASLGLAITGPATAVAAAGSSPTNVTVPSQGAVGAPAPSTAQVVRAARVFLRTLSREQRRRVLLDFDDGKRQAGWSNVPTAGFPRPGLALGELEPRQRRAAMTVLEAALSDEGYREVEENLAIDDYLSRAATVEGGVPPDVVYGSGYYNISFFGTPSRWSPFALQFTGHHVAHNLTYAGGKVSTTPQFMGVEQPREGDGSQVRPLEDESSSVVAMLDSLTADQRAAAQISVPFTDLLLGAGVDGPFPAPAGQRVSDLGQEQQDKVTATLRAWVGDIDERTAEALVADYVAAYDETYIAWSGATTLDDVDTYARVDGPRLWIEFSVQAPLALKDSVHFHTIYRDQTTDYGSR